MIVSLSLEEREFAGSTLFGILTRTTLTLLYVVDVVNH